MTSREGNISRSLKDVCETALAKKTSEGQGRKKSQRHNNSNDNNNKNNYVRREKHKKEEENEKETLELLFRPENLEFSEVPAVKALQDAVRRFVNKHPELLSTTGNSNDGTTEGVEKESFQLQNTLVSSTSDAMRDISREWKEILENMYTVDWNDSARLPEDTNITDDVASPNNILCFDASHGETWEELRFEEKHSRDDAREFLDSCLREWREKGSSIHGKSEVFIRALREIIDTELEVIAFGSNWEFWLNSLLQCVETQSTSLEAISVMELIYSQCTTKRKLILVNCIAMRVQQTVESAADEKENLLLELFHRLLLCSSENVVAFLNDEMTHLFLQGLRVVVDHIVFFNTIDPQAMWLKRLLLCPSLVRDITTLFTSEPSIINKLTSAIPAVHAIGLMVIMLPLWVKTHGEDTAFILIFDKLVDAILNKHVPHDMLDSAMTCMERCVGSGSGICADKRYEYFSKVYDFIITIEEPSEVNGSVQLLLRLLLCFARPSSSYASNFIYRLQLMHLRPLEEKLLRRSEKWAKLCAANKISVGDFWWNMLRWYAAELPKVVARAVRAACRHTKRVDLPWDAGHLVAISCTISSWRGLEEVMEDEHRAGSLNYISLLCNICAGDARLLLKCKEKEKVEVEEEQEVNIPARLGPSVWWLLMRWCTNAYARRGLFLATTEILASLTKDMDVNTNNFLPIPAEEFDMLHEMPHVIPVEELTQQRILVSILSVRLWIATLNSFSQPLDIIPDLCIHEMLIQQIQACHTEISNDSFGDDSFLLLLCVLSLNTLTDIKIKGRNSKEKEKEENDPLKNMVEKLIRERHGYDPVRQLLEFLLYNNIFDHFADVLVYRFQTIHDAPIRKINAENHAPSVLYSIKEKEFCALHKLLQLQKVEKKEIEEQKKKNNLFHIIQILYQLHMGDVFRTVTAFKAHSQLEWESYGQYADLAIGVVGHLVKMFPHIESRLRCEGVDVYYLSLLCIRRWLQDPIKSPELAITSIEKFMSLGQAAWEESVAKCLGSHIMAIWDQFSETDALSCLFAGSFVFPVSLFWVLCLTKEFDLYYENV